MGKYSLTSKLVHGLTTVITVIYVPLITHAQTPPNSLYEVLFESHPSPPKTYLNQEKSLPGLLGTLYPHDSWKYKKVELNIDSIEHTLSITIDGQPIKEYPIARGPVDGPKRQYKDLKTPQGKYHIVSIRGINKDPSFLLNYPNSDDARLAYDQKRIDYKTLAEIIDSEKNCRGPIRHTVLGGGINIHIGATDIDATLGCVEMEKESLQELAIIVKAGCHGTKVNIK